MRFRIFGLILLLGTAAPSLSAQAHSAAPLRPQPLASAGALQVRPGHELGLGLDSPLLPTRVEQAPTARQPSLGRSVGWGALLGAGAGVLTGLTVLSLCDDYCEGVRAEGMVLHVSVGATAGAALGAVAHWVRR